MSAQTGDGLPGVRDHPKQCMGYVAPESGKVSTRAAEGARGRARSVEEAAQLEEAHAGELVAEDCASRSRARRDHRRSAATTCWGVSSRASASASRPCPASTPTGEQGDDRPVEPASSRRVPIHDGQSSGAARPARAVVRGSRRRPAAQRPRRAAAASVAAGGNPATARGVASPALPSTWTTRLSTQRLCADARGSADGSPVVDVTRGFVYALLPTGRRSCCGSRAASS